MNPKGPILFFDSGVGGLSVVKEARILMPDRAYVYVADDAAFPYGDWQEDALRARLIALFGELIARFAPSIIVIPCNTASTLVISDLRAAYPEETFVGTVPAIKPAAERTRSGLVSVLATPGTVRRQYTFDLIRDYASRCEVNLVGSENLARLAEQYMREGHVEEADVAREIAPCFQEKDGRRTDIVVLACTHYPFLVNRMRKMAPWPVDWIDTSEAIARRALLLASTLPLPDAQPQGRDVAIVTSGNVTKPLARLMTGFGFALQA
ncbi:glutamate racemase [Nitratireductor sp. CH_MIT9313-5]|jgi:glutamate racemase|uniref:glutamate racemase n=1 Tax=Nitratireductor sp. CH_MIT9313-5 TaxID=3107764 RepID=UPI003008BB0B